LLFFTHLTTIPMQTDLHKIWYWGTGSGPDHPCKIFWWSVNGRRFCGQSKMYPCHWLSQWLSTLCWCNCAVEWCVYKWIGKYT